MIRCMRSDLKEEQGVEVRGATFLSVAQWVERHCMQCMIQGRESLHCHIAGCQYNVYMACSPVE